MRVAIRVDGSNELGWGHVVRCLALGETLKVSRIDDIPEGQDITLFRHGGFVDLCRGPHVRHAGQIGAVKLLEAAGAYWRGDEKNPMLQRIYGTAWRNKKELNEYLTMLEEAKKRDHRKLGRELEIYIFDEEVGPGLPLWLPNGAILIAELEKLAIETEQRAGYQRVRTPHLTKEDLFLRSGHLPYYAESMFPRMEMDEHREQRAKLAARIAELEKQLADYAKTLK